MKKADRSAAIQVSLFGPEVWRMRFLFVMDPMDRILPDKDTTFAFQRAAEHRKHDCFHALVQEVFVRDGIAYASYRSVRVSDAAPHVTRW